jgi:hypothetical protein
MRRPLTSRGLRTYVYVHVSRVCTDEWKGLALCGAVALQAALRRLRAMRRENANGTHERVRSRRQS